MLGRILGPVDAVVDGKPVSLGGRAQQKLLCLLVVAGSSGSAIDELAGELWDPDERPANPSNAVRTSVSRLRGVLGAESVVVSNSIVTLKNTTTDLEEFEDLVARARRAGDSPVAAELWTQTMELWRGPPFDGLDKDLARLVPAAARLGEMRAEAIEASMSARLAAGEVREVVGDLEAAVAEFPLREGLRAQHMTALANAGRQAEALRAFQDFHAEMTEIGLEPSASLRRLDAKIGSGEQVSATPMRDLRGYKLGERLGEGAFSVVYRGTQESVGREVAVKQIRAELADRPEFIRLFEAEAHLVARLEHPHIVPLYDYWRDPGSAYLVMRYLRGGSMAAAILHEPMDLEQATAVLVQVADALDTAHLAGVIHRGHQASQCSVG